MQRLFDNSTDFGLPCEALHLFAPRIIGKHEWRMVIIPSRFGGWSLEYYWRRVQPFRDTWTNRWHPTTEWPTYNHNDGCYGGMPRTLRTYWEEHEAEVKHWIKHGCAPSASAAPQLSLFVEA